MFLFEGGLSERPAVTDKPSALITNRQLLATKCVYRHKLVTANRL